MDQQETLPTRLKRLMEAAGFTQTAFAVKTGIDRSVLNRALNGRGTLSPIHLQWAATALKIDLKELLADVSVDARQAAALKAAAEPIRRALRAEQARDSLQRQLEEERARHEVEVQNLCRQIEQERAAHGEEIHRLQLHQQGEIRRLRTALDAERTARLGSDRASAVLRAQVRQLEANLTTARAAKEKSGLFAVAGLLGGLALASTASK